MPKAPWKTDQGIDAVVSAWLASRTVSPCFVANRSYDASPASTTALPDLLAPALQNALRKRGIHTLYSHQARAFALVTRSPASSPRPRCIVIATPTASGKSLCFHLPVLQAIIDDPHNRALYIYPTKALSRDQEHGIQQLVADAGIHVGAVVFDGDTPSDARRAARERSPIILTNPDMLHTSILPHHASWARTFQGLRYVVIDELHTYRGVFGSHMAHVIARLQRVARFHGASPVFLCATATIGNPLEHAARLMGLNPEQPDQIALIEQSGAPRGPRQFYLYNPPVVDQTLGIRASYIKCSVSLAADLVRAKVPTIVFGQSRNAVEIMLKYLRAKLAGTVPETALMAYRGGYLPAQRRRIERGLRDGDILGVIATNALELGIDIGDLQAVICAGYPGSVAAMWQRFGRAGRRQEKSLAVLVGRSHPVDQYLASDPEFLLGASAEHARIDPLNTEILVQHLKCAAFEIPFRSQAFAATAPTTPAAVNDTDAADAYAGLNASETQEALGYLAQHGVLFESAGKFHWASDAYPANHVSLRSIGWDNFVIVENGRTLAELDWRGAHTMLHEQAIYQHDGEQYQVEHLDFENHKAYVKKVEPDYYTDAMVYTRLSVIDLEVRRPVPPATCAWGEVSVVEKVVGYKKIKYFTHENVGYGDVFLPDMQMHTTSYMLTVPWELCQRVEGGSSAAIEGLRGVGKALETVACLALLCEPGDIGQTLGDQGPEEVVPNRQQQGPRAGFDPTVFLYDHVPGGVGLAERIYERTEELVERAFGLVQRCRCQCGCPVCVGATDTVSGVRKHAAMQMFGILLGG